MIYFFVFLYNISSIKIMKKNKSPQKYIYLLGNFINAKITIGIEIMQVIKNMILSFLFLKFP
jgi:hypothetical protein